MPEPANPGAAGLSQEAAVIICLEGASAAGKTTLSYAIAARTGAAVIPEVRALFELPSPEPPLWYLERQVDGSAGALIIVFVWVYYSAQIFLLGAEFTKAYGDQRRIDD